MFSFIETRLFTKLVLEYFSDEDYAALQAALMQHPESGPVIPGSGGVRAKYVASWSWVKWDTAALRAWPICCSASDLGPKLITIIRWQLPPATDWSPRIDRVLRPF